MILKYFSLVIPYVKILTRERRYETKSEKRAASHCALYIAGVAKLVVMIFATLAVIRKLVTMMGVTWKGVIMIRAIAYKLMLWIYDKPIFLLMLKRTINATT